MKHPLDSIIDDALMKAAKDGSFDNLPGAGKPLKLLDNPADAVLNRMMTTANVKPPLVALAEEIKAAQSHLKTLTDEDQRKAQMKKLSDLQMRLAMEKEAFNRYG